MVWEGWAWWWGGAMINEEHEGSAANATSCAGETPKDGLEKGTHYRGVNKQVCAVCALGAVLPAGICPASRQH